MQPTELTSVIFNQARAVNCHDSQAPADRGLCGRHSAVSSGQRAEQELEHRAGLRAVPRRRSQQFDAHQKGEVFDAGKVELHEGYGARRCILALARHHPQGPVITQLAFDGQRARQNSRLRLRKENDDARIPAVLYIGFPTVDGARADHGQAPFTQGRRVGTRRYSVGVYVRKDALQRPPRRFVRATIRNSGPGARTAQSEINGTSVAGTGGANPANDPSFAGRHPSSTAGR